jgi:hypothetical protein
MTGRVEESRLDFMKQETGLLVASLPATRPAERRQA